MNEMDKVELLLSLNEGNYTIINGIKNEEDFVLEIDKTLRLICYDKDTETEKYNKQVEELTQAYYREGKEVYVFDKSMKQFVNLERTLEFELKNN